MEEKNVVESTTKIQVRDNEKYLEPENKQEATSIKSQSSYKSYPSMPLEYNSENEGVKILQERLISKGYDIPGGPSGFYGVATKKAVSKFYFDTGIGTSSGNHMGPKAWNILFGE